MVREMYRKISGWDATLEPCPFCGSAAELWEYSPSEDHHQKVVMCSNNGDEDADTEECPMFMPPDGFYRATKSEARDIWNTRKALAALQAEPDQAISEAYDSGFRRCTEWARRDDLLCDVGSPAYLKDKAFDLRFDAGVEVALQPTKLPEGLPDLITHCRKIMYPMVTSGCAEIVESMQAALARVEASIAAAPAAGEGE